EGGELACAIPNQELKRSRELPEVHQDVAGCLGRPGAVRVGGDAGQVNAAGAVLDDDQGVNATEQHGVHMDEIGREDAAGLRGEELHRGEEIGSGPVERLEVLYEAVSRLVQAGVMEPTANVGSDRLERVDLRRGPWAPRAQAGGRDEPAELLASTERRGDVRHDAYAEHALANRTGYQPAFLAANILEHQAGAVPEQPLEVLEQAA